MITGRWIMVCFSGNFESDAIVVIILISIRCQETDGRRDMLSVVAADDDFLYGSSPGTDTDHGLASALPPTLQQPNQGTAARVWASGYQEHDQVCKS